MVIWHSIGVNERSPDFPALREIERTLSGAALLLCVWIVLRPWF